MYINAGQQYIHIVHSQPFNDNLGLDFCHLALFGN